MKRTFLAKRNALLTSASFSAGAIALGIAVIVLAVRLLFPNAFYSAAAPVLRLSASLSNAVHSVFAGFADASALAARNEALQRENAALVSENRTLLANAQAQAELPEGILAEVITRPPESPYDTLVVAAGGKEGVAAGMEAFGPGGVPIGVVTDVLPDFSRIVLFTSPSLRVSARVGDRQTPVFLQGAGGGAFRASVSRLSEVAVGDQVAVSAGSAAPLGSVVAVKSDSSSPVVVLSIQGAVNPFSLTWVSLRGTGAAFVGALSWENAESL